MQTYNAECGPSAKAKTKQQAEHFCGQKTVELELAARCRPGDHARKPESLHTPGERHLLPAKRHEKSSKNGKAKAGLTAGVTGKCGT